MKPTSNSRFMENSNSDNLDLKLAETIRDICAREARDGFMDASIQGLCTEGAMEAAVSAIERIDLKKVIEKLNKTEP